MPQKRIFSIEIQLILIFGLTPSLNFGAILSHVNKSIEIQLKPEIKQKYPDFNCDKRQTWGKIFSHVFSEGVSPNIKYNNNLFKD